MIEPLRRSGTGIERPFSALAGISCRGSSLPLQRVRTTEQHAQRIYEHEAARELRPGTAADVIFIGELDGSMAPVVEPSLAADDKRKGKVLSWKEVRLNLVHPQDSVSPRFGGNCAGGVEESGRQGWRCAVKAGFGPGSHLHAVGDGAPWIANQVELQVDPQGHYLVDFFHLCEYLSAAATVGAPDHPQAWLDLQQDRLKANHVTAVLDTLAPFVRADKDDDPVTACDRYLRHRLDQLDYQGALQRSLPIGSGEIESAHRYIIQERLKLTGAWWSPAHIETMLALRLNRANGEWEAYWRGVEKEAA